MRGQVKFVQTKIIAKKRRRLILISLYSILFVGLVISGLSFVSHLESVTVSRIESSGNSRLSSIEIESLVREKVAGNFLGLFSRSNAFIYPQDEILKSLEGNTLVKSARVGREGLRGLTIDIEEREEVAWWCSGQALSLLDCYSLDENGYIFGKVVGAASSTSPVVYRSDLADMPLGANFLPPEEFKTIRFFIGQLDGLSVKPIEASISEANYLIIHLGDGGRFIINRVDDLSEVLGNIAAIISDKSVAPSLSDFLRTLDYVKLDSGNKVVYKIK